MGHDRLPLFVRLPAPLLSDLATRIASEGRTKQAVVEELLTSQLQAPSTRDSDQVLDLDEVATMLRVEPSDVLDRIKKGDFPARRFGDQWRISPTAVVAWLHGTDALTDHRTGFSSS